MKKLNRYKTMNSINPLVLVMLFSLVFSCQKKQEPSLNHQYNGWYEGEYLEHLAFPIGGMGAGMVTLDGSGSLSHFSVRNKPDIFNDPEQFAVIHVKGIQNGTKVLEGKDQRWHPCFESARFLARFPFGIVELSDSDFPLGVTITGWSPFIPNDPDNSSLPVGALEYTFTNHSDSAREAIFSYHSRNIMKMQDEGNAIKPFPNGFVLHQSGSQDNPHYQGDFAFFMDDGRFGRWDGSWFGAPARVWLWKNLKAGNILSDKDQSAISVNPGDISLGSVYKTISLEPGESQTVPLLFAWYVPGTDVRRGASPTEKIQGVSEKASSGNSEKYYKPWYAEAYNSLEEIAGYWKDNYDRLKETSNLFKEAFYASTLPDAAMEAVAANLTILKSPTVLRTRHGKFWAWEGCDDTRGLGRGTCTHVWNYAQAVPHLFPSLERGVHETKFFVDQNEEGHQNFRSNIPISPPYHHYFEGAPDVEHRYYPAADGQLGGIMKVYREWRISGDTDWLRKLWPKVEQSFNYCSKFWDPKQKGILEEPQHNTYDCEFWGPNGMLTSFYLGAMQAMIKMGNALGKDVSKYKQLFEKGKQYMESALFNGEYFYQKIMMEELEANNPLDKSEDLSPKIRELILKEGPLYQYGKGVLSDGVLGLWIARMCGLCDFIDQDKVLSHLYAVHQYNFKDDLSDHVNPMRPTYALGHEAGLLLCTWPKGDPLTFPFRYNTEVWTGTEYQVASHLMMHSEVDKGLDIVRAVRNRYDGRVRNPFNEFEWGHWYGRAMSSYGLIQGLTGVRYDAMDKTLYIDSRIGDDFTSFLSTATGWGNAGLQNGKPFVDVKYGEIQVDHMVISGKVIQ